jgi:hypothetical protein
MANYHQFDVGTAFPSGVWFIRVALFKSYMFSIWNCVLSFLFYFSWFCRFLLMHCLWAYHVVVPSNFTYKGQGHVNKIPTLLFKKIT